MKITIVRILPVLLAAVSAGLVTSASDEPRFPIHTWQVDEHTTGLLVEDHRAPIISLNLEFTAGTWSAWGQMKDLSTALSASFYDPDAELRRRSDELVAGIGLGVGSRAGSLTASCLKDDLPEVLQLVRDVLANDDFDRSEVKRWKQQAALSWKSRETDVSFQGRRLMVRVLFREGDPRRRPYDEPRRVETDTVELRKIRDRIIRLPGRVIGLAGDLTPKEAEAVARDLLPQSMADGGGELGSALLPIRPREERQDATAHVRRLTQVYFGLGRESLTYDDPDYPAFVLANHVLGGHFYSRLSVALRHEGGETYGAGVRSEGGVDPGPFVLGSFTKTDNAAHAEEKMRKVLRVFHADGITEDERAETVSHFLGRAPFGRQSAGQLLWRRLSERRAGLPDGFFDQLPNRIAALSLDEINAFISTYYDPARFVMGRVAPQGD